MRVEEGKREVGTWWRISWSLTGVHAESVDIREGVTVSISTSIVSGDTKGGKSNNGLEHGHVCVIISH